MTDLEEIIRGKTNRFVYELTELVKRAVVESARLALGEGGRSSVARARSGRAGARTVKKRPNQGPGQRQNAGHADRRTLEKRRTPKAVRAQPSQPSELLDGLANDLFLQIQSRPGQCMNEIVQAMSASTDELVASARNLIEQKRITTYGEGETMRYFPLRRAPKNGRKKKKRKGR